MFIRSFPDDIELLAFFESEPVFQNSQDLHFSYKYQCNDGVSLVFSFSVTSGWIQAVLEFNEKEISRYLMEGVEYFSVQKDSVGEYISTEIVLKDTRTHVEIRLQPFITVKFATLIR